MMLRGTPAFGNFRRKCKREATTGQDVSRLCSTALAYGLNMSENEAASSALGKRARDSGEEADGSGRPAEVPDMPAGDVDDSSDEEIGPMPVAEEADGAAENGKGRKKRKRAGKSW